MSEIRADEWLKELERLTSRNDDGMTTSEMSDATGMSRRTIGERLRKAHRLGWVKVGWRREVRLDGKTHEVPVYKIEVPRKGKKP